MLATAPPTASTAGREPTRSDWTPRTRSLVRQRPTPPGPVSQSAQWARRRPRGPALKGACREVPCWGLWQLGPAGFDGRGLQGLVERRTFPAEEDEQAERRDAGR